MFTHQDGLIDTIRFLLEDFTDAKRIVLKGLVSQSFFSCHCVNVNLSLLEVQEINEMNEYLSRNATGILALDTSVWKTPFSKQKYQELISGYTKTQDY